MQVLSECDVGGPREKSLRSPFKNADKRRFMLATVFPGFDRSQSMCDHATVVVLTVGVAGRKGGGSSHWGSLISLSPSLVVATLLWHLRL